MLNFGRKGFYSVREAELASMGSSEERIGFFAKVIQELDDAERGEGGRFSRMSPSKRAVLVRRDAVPSEDLGIGEPPSRFHNILRKVMVLFAILSVLGHLSCLHVCLFVF
jgi:hypothetical protein